MTKKLAKIVLAVALFLGAAQGLKAQVDVAFSQFYANPLYLNPAFAGSKVCPRVSLNYRSQWPSLVSAFTTVSASYDQYIDALHGGVGAILMTDRQGDHAALSTSSLAVMYACYAFLHKGGKVMRLLAIILVVGFILGVLGIIESLITQ